ncbi:reverse transcriptase domain-containing protein [Archangium sp.]|uniref:reverse transcriptase domain-containing protein n=1 Tax=Archangium sp. TaxID=1872627 RepID=UPI00389A8316
MKQPGISLFQVGIPEKGLDLLGAPQESRDMYFLAVGVGGWRAIASLVFFGYAMSDLIFKTIQAEARKLVARHQQYAFGLHEETRRLQERSGLVWTKEVLTPEYWGCNDGFNPYHVRKHAKSIAYAVEKSLKTKLYRPRPAIRYSVPKDDGSPRNVSVFQVADQAIARLVFKRLLEKNKGRFSSKSFAYRSDLTVHDAVLHLSSSFAGRKRIFMAEYDFRKYFDSISHDHIERVLNDKRFYITDEERKIIQGFLRSSIYSIADYQLGHTQKRNKGIPQGVSTSLFLANIAAYPLDRRLEQLRVDFARYADDTLVWSDDYGELCHAVEVLAATADEMGVEFNLKKSPGVRMLVEEGAGAELAKTTYVEFVGYKVNAHTIGIRDSTAERIKSHIARLIYANLLEQPLAGRCIPGRVSGPRDADYTVMISQIRRYLYGELTEEKLAKYLSGDTPEMRYRGLMSFYPIVDDDTQLKQLDGWLLHTIYTSLLRRAELFQQAGLQVTARPHGFPKEELTSPNLGFYRIPSFRRIAKMLNKAARKYGPSSVAHPVGPSS